MTDKQDAEALTTALRWLYDATHELYARKKKWWQPRWWHPDVRKVETAMLNAEEVLEVNGRWPTR